MQNVNWEWLSWKFFDPSFVSEFHWDNALFLLLVPIVPLLFVLRWILYFPLRQKFDIALPTNSMNKWNFVQTLRLIPISLQIISIMFLLLAMARPQTLDEHIEQYDEGINIMLVVDISESMQLEDLRPNRLEAAKEVARKFIKGRTDDRIGIAVFAGEAYTLSPLTNDYDILNQYITEMNFNMIESSGTAIGNALGVAINRLNEIEKGAKIIILMSDGENTAGIIDPFAAANLAYIYNVKIYSIGIGKEGEVNFGKDSLGNSQKVMSHLDENLLRKISEQTKGNYYRATNNNSLTEILFTINKLEKGKIEETRYKDTHDYYYVYLNWSILFFLLWLSTKISYLNNFLED